MTDPILVLDHVQTYIQQHHILQGVSLRVMPGRITVLLGRNGAGKSTTLRTIMGLTPSRSGHIRLNGQEIQDLKTFEIVRRGIGYVPEDQSILATLTVGENLRLAMLQETEAAWKRSERVFELFPDLRKFINQTAGYLSGGQKQMLAIARAFIGENSLLLIDEPSKGLAPLLVQQLGESLNQIKQSTTVILVEQNFFLASQVGSEVFILDDGRVVHEGIMEELTHDQALKQKYLGIS